MSKLDEVIQVLDDALNFRQFCFVLIDPDVAGKIIETLHELNKPAQYTVEIKQPDLAFEIEEYSAYMNGHRTVSADTIPEIKDKVLLHINKIRGFLSLPPITIEQVTFVEL